MALQLLLVSSVSQESHKNVLYVSLLVSSSDVATPIINSNRGSVPKGKSRSCGRLLGFVCMTVVAYLLLLSGDVETNPGPQCKFAMIF